MRRKVLPRAAIDGFPDSPGPVILEVSRSACAGSLPDKLSFKFGGGPEHLERGHGEEARNPWTYYAGREQAGSPVEAASIAKRAKRASRTYTNLDVERVSQKSEDFKKK